MKKIHSYYGGKVQLIEFNGSVQVSFCQFGFTSTLSVCNSQYVFGIHAPCLNEAIRIQNLLMGAYKSFYMHKPEAINDYRGLDLFDVLSS